MANIEDEEEQPIPGRRSPFRVLHKKDGKTYVEPDARLITTEQVHEQGGWLRDFRKFIEKWDIHYYVFLFLMTLGGYEAGAHYYPQYAGLITGGVLLSIVVGNTFAHSSALRDDTHHIEWVHVMSFEAQEVNLGANLDDINVSNNIIKVKITSDMLYEIRDYMKLAESKYRVEFINDQVFEGLTKIHEDTTVDPTERLFVGERNGIPAGVIFKLGVPSQDYVSKQVKKVQKEMEANGNKYEDIQKVATMYKAWKNMYKYINKYVEKKGMTAFPIDDRHKWEKDYFFALEKASIPYWKQDRNAKEPGLEYWDSLTPELKVPMLLSIQRAYNDVSGEKVRLIATREADKVEAQGRALEDIMGLLGISENALKKLLVQKENSITPIEDKETQKAKEEVENGIPGQ
jgi:hypothetical protein